MAIRLLLGLHEKYWHAPPGDLKNLLARTGMPLEVLNLVGDAVMKCEICRKYVRLPNRPQLKVHNAGTFNQCVQADLFKIWGDWVLVLIDEATRYKVAVTTQTREAQELLQKLLEYWMRYFGPPASLVMDQEGSLMSHETAAEFERLNIERKPRGTTAGAAAAQHTGTGLVERHIGLLRLTMMKLKAELNRQGIRYETSEIAMEAAMAQNSTLNYGGVTPAMAVFGILPRGFYDDESSGILSKAGALQSDLTVFEKALRIRQMSLSAVQKAIVEDRTARANKTRSHRLDTASLVPGTSEIEFYRDILGDVGWRGPALLLHLDADEGVAVIQYQGRPYLVSIRHIRPHVQTFATEQTSLKLNDQAEDELFDLMKMVEAVPPQSKRMLGFLPDHQAAGMVWRKIPGGDSFNEPMFKKAKIVSSSLTTRELTGIVYGRALKFLRPPMNTTGYAVTWKAGSNKYCIQEHWQSTALKMKKMSAEKEDDMCSIYLYYYVVNQEGETEKAWRQSNQPMELSSSPLPEARINDEEEMESPPQDDGGMSVASMEEDHEAHGVKRDGPETRTVVIAPERKRQKFDGWSSHSTYYNLSSLQYLLDCKKLYKIEFPDQWKGQQMWAENNLSMKFFQEEINYRKHKLNNKGDFLFHIGSSEDAILHVDVRTSEVWKVDTEHDDIGEEAALKIWPLVEEADRLEVEQFVQEAAFEKVHRLAITDDMVVIARWARKWKKLADGKKKVKSRLCARGCLDKQKALLTTRSTTATRLSQRLLLSTAAVFDMEVESWDIAGAFLKGLNFNQIRQMLRDMGINSPVRQVIIIPPLNTWRHLASADTKFKVNNPEDWALLCLKPIYGLNDAPLAWQLSLHSYLREIKAHPSHMDENSWRWKNPDGSLLALCTCHVDDVAIAGPKKWLEAHYQAFVKKFKKVTRQQLPFEHCGSRYEKIGSGFRMVQSDFCAKMTPANIGSDRKDNDKLRPEEVTSYRSILGALLWLTATRLDLIAEVSTLASYVTTAEIRHLRMANQVLKRAQLPDYGDVGLYFMKLRPEKGLRLACFHDSSSFTKEKAYAHEGIVVLLMEDHVVPKDDEYEVICDDNQVRRHGGRAHVLWSHGAKAKRIAYSTSHAETLAAISGHEAAVMVSIRLSQLLHRSDRPTLQQLAAIQEAGNPQLPIDDYGDCNDVYQLVTMCKTLPQDKTQRIYILSLRESRLAGRVRWVALTPTESMVADVLTKPMFAPQMLKLLTSGVLDMKNEETHHVQMRRLPPKAEIEEDDLSHSDEQLIEEYKKTPVTVKNGWLTSMPAMIAAGKLPSSAALILCSLPIAKAANAEDGQGGDAGYLIPFLIATVVVLMTERIVTALTGRLGSWFNSTSTTPRTLSEPSTQRSQSMTWLEPRSSDIGSEVEKVEMKDQGCQYDPLLDDSHRPVAWKADRDKIRALEREVREARDLITKEKLSHEAHARKLLGEARDAQQRYETLKASVEAQGSSTDTSHLEIPEFIHVTNGGDSFHRQGCPSLACHFQPTPHGKVQEVLLTHRNRRRADRSEVAHVQFYACSYTHTSGLERIKKSCDSKSLIPFARILTKNPKTFWEVLLKCICGMMKSEFDVGPLIHLVPRIKICQFRAGKLRG